MTLFMTGRLRLWFANTFRFRRTQKLPPLPTTFTSSTPSSSANGTIDPQASLQNTLAQIHVENDLIVCLAHIGDLKEHIKLYEVSALCQRDIFRAAVPLLIATDVGFIDAGYDLVYTLFTECFDILPVLRYEIFQTVWALHNPVHQSRRPGFLAALFKNGRDISGFEATALSILMSLSQDCRDAYTASQADHITSVAIEPTTEVSTAASSQASTIKLQDTYHKTLKLICGVIKQGKGLDQTLIPDLVKQIHQMIVTTSNDEDAGQLLKIFDAMLTFGSVVSDDLLPTLVKSICNVHGFDEPEKHSVSINQAWRSFDTLIRTHFDQYGINQILLILNEGRRLDGVTPQETFGALRILGKILADPLVDTSTALDFDSLIYSFKYAINPWNPHPSHDDRLYILRLLSEREHLQKLLLNAPDWQELTAVILDIFHRLKKAPGDTASQLQTIDGMLTRLDALHLSDAQRETLDRLYFTLAPHIPTDIVDGLLERYKRPMGMPDSYNELQHITNAFLLNPQLSIKTRQKAAAIFRATCLDLQLQEPTLFDACLQMLLDLLSNREVDVNVHARLVGLAVDCLLDLELDGAADTYYDRIVPLLFDIAHRPVPEAVAISHSSNAANGVVKIFIHAIEHSAPRSLSLYNLILDFVTQEPRNEPSTVVAFLRLLFRMRSDTNNRIFLVDNAEGETLATALRRSKKANKLKYARPAMIKQPSRPAVWMYGEFAGLPVRAPPSVSPFLTSRSTGTSGAAALNIKRWLTAVIDVIEGDADWEILSYIIVHLGPQLTNKALFVDTREEIERLRALVTHQIYSTKVYKPDADATGLKQADVAVCLCDVLTTLIAYHDIFDVTGMNRMVDAFKKGLTAWDKTTIPCVHAITVCCYEMPESLWRNIYPIVHLMSTMVTKKDAAIHLLEFLAGLSRLPHLLSGFNGEEIKIVFGVCFSYIKYAREKRFDDARRRARLPSVSSANSAKISDRTSSLSGDSESPPSSSRSPSSPTGARAPTSSVLDKMPGRRSANTATATAASEIPEYVFTLAYNVIVFYFFRIKPEVRGYYLEYMLPLLLLPDEEGKREDQALVVLDLIWRVTHRGQTHNDFGTALTTPEGTAQYTSGYSVLSIHCDKENNLARLNERRASGVDHWTLPLDECKSPEEVYAKHIEASHFGPFTDGCNYTPLPAIDVARRALFFLDRATAVDFYKVGIIYIGEDQTTEPDILSNTMGSPDYVHLLNGLGERLKLAGVKHNTMGLDTCSDADGDHTIWHNDHLITSLIYHVTTFMPTNLDADPACIRKKAHIGNDFVNIVFNNSSLPFDFNTFPSAFNYVYIVVTPEARATFIETRTRSQEQGWYENSWFKLQVMTREDFPNISSAGTTKIVSGKALAKYVRNLALNACVFCNVWAAREYGSQPSSWQARLHHIRNIKERYG